MKNTHRSFAANYLRQITEANGGGVRYNPNLELAVSNGKFPTTSDLSAEVGATTEYEYYSFTTSTTSTTTTTTSSGTTGSTEWC
jgi:hypothetical protein